MKRFKSILALLLAAALLLSLAACGATESEKPAEEAPPTEQPEAEAETGEFDWTPYEYNASRTTGIKYLGDEADARPGQSYNAEGFYIMVFDDTKDVMIKGLAMDGSTAGASSGELIIPASIDGYPVVSVQDAAFSLGGNKFSSLTVQDGVQYIGGNAFSDSGFKSINLPESLIYIGDAAFSSCEQLEEAVLPANLTAVNTHLFDGCTSLKSVSLPEGVESIGSFAFWECKLTEITFPSTLKVIARSSFYCNSISEVVIPEGVVAIGSGVFEGNEPLESVVIPGSVETIGEIAFDSYNYDKEITIYCEDGSFAMQYAKDNNIKYRTDGYKPVEGEGAEAVTGNETETSAETPEEGPAEQPEEGAAGEPAGNG